MGTWAGPEADRSVWPPSATSSLPLLCAQDSPTNKLLYAKEIPEYRKIVQRYYKQIHDMTPLSEQEMNAHLAEESRVRLALHRLVGAGLGVADFQGEAGRSWGLVHHPPGWAGLQGSAYHPFPLPTPSS